MPLLLALALACAAPGGSAARHAALDARQATVTIGEPRVLAMESPDGWVEPPGDLVAPVPLAPMRLVVMIPAPRRPPAPVLDTI